MSTCRQQIADRVNNGVAWKTPSCICSCQLCIKSEVCCGTVGRCGDGWKLRWIAGEACNMTENALSILIIIFSVQLQQTKISERKLFIFHHGRPRALLFGFIIKPYLPNLTCPRAYSQRPSDYSQPEGKGPLQPSRALNVHFF